MTPSGFLKTGKTTRGPESGKELKDPTSRERSLPTASCGHISASRARQLATSWGKVTEYYSSVRLKPDGKIPTFQRWSAELETGFGLLGVKDILDFDMYLRSQHSCYKTKTNFILNIFRQTR
jgi:hypothetical protein